jgi:hypothetical protein
LQIVTAQPGWKAIYCQEAANRQVKIFHRVILCWALVEAIGTGEARSTEVRGVVHECNDLGIVGDLIATDKENGESAIGSQYFIGYNDPDAHKETDYWIEQAHLRFKTEVDKRAKQNERRLASFTNDVNDREPVT